MNLLMKQSEKKTFLLGPLASPILFSAIMMITQELTQAPTSFVELVFSFKAHVFIFSLSAIYSYLFTFIFGLPIYLLFIHKKWQSFLSYNFGAMLASSIASIPIYFIANEYSKSFLVISTFVCATINANFMWFLSKKFS